MTLISILFFLLIYFVAIKCFLFLFFLSEECTFLQDFCHARVTTRFLLIFKYLLITYCLTSKQMKTGGKNNSCVTIEWKVFWLSCNAKKANKKLSLSKYIKAQWRRAEDCTLSVTGIVIVWLPCVADKVECRKLPSG